MLRLRRGEVVVESMDGGFGTAGAGCRCFVCDGGEGSGLLSSFSDSHRPGK